MKELKRKMILECCEGILQSQLILLEKQSIEAVKLRADFEKELKRLNQIILN
jgi:hypothetical protein